ITASGPIKITRKRGETCEKKECARAQGLYLKRQQIVTIIGPESVILHPGLGGLYGSLRNSLQSGEMLLLGFEILSLLLLTQLY
ncbi:mCG146173, partial [Mus musculus]